MPDLTFYNQLTMESRRWPALNPPLRRTRRFLAGTIPAMFADLARIFSPRSCFRIGPPKSSFSIYQSLRCENRPARVLVTDQGAPKATEGSMLVISKCLQHACQPWPIFWSQHPNARLVASSLALLDDRKRLCRESAYNDFAMEDDPAWRYLYLPK